MNELRWTTADIPDQTGRTVVVTGANSGLGLRTAEALAAKGARVLLACRNPQKAADALAAVGAVATDAAPEFVAMDLADLASVRRAADEIAEKVGALDVLVNNAGVMAVPRGRPADGFELQFGTNHLGHYALTGALLPALLRSSAPRVVTVSSIAHWGGVIRFRDPNWKRFYLRWPAYSQAKLANLMFVSELDRRARSAGTALVSVGAHPGLSDTHLYDVGQETGLRSMVAAVPQAILKAFAQPDALGALPQLRAATAADVRGNDYFGPSGPLPGPFEIRGYPKRALRSPLASHTAGAARLWDLSERLTSVTFPWPTQPMAGAGKPIEQEHSSGR